MWRRNTVKKEIDREKDKRLAETGLYLFELIRAALHEKKAEEKPETCGWKALYQLAKHNDVENLCVYGIKTLENLPPEILWNQWKKLPEYITFRMLKIDLEREWILKEMEKNGISHLLLKGNKIADCYPKAGMRKMSDNDILFGYVENSGEGYQIKGRSEREKERASRNAGKIVRDIMKKRGYLQIEKGIVHDVFEKDSFYIFEMHKKLMSRQTSLHEYYENPWKRAVKCIENPYEYYFSDADELIYMLAHAYKHFSEAGCGIRILADIYVFIQKKKASIDWEYVRKELKELHIEVFAKQLYDLSEKLLGVDRKELLPEELRTLEFMLGAGSYGKTEIKVKKETEKNGRFGYVFRRIFPPKLFWYETFPICETYPWMIGFFWLYRVVTSPFKQRKRVKSELQALLKKKQ